MRIIKHEISYNSQRNNFDFKGKFKAWNQCFSTCAWMLMSFYSKKIDGKDDESLARYVDDVESTVGKPGIGERVKRKFNWISGRTSYWWLVQKDGIDEWLSVRGVEGKPIFRENLIFDDLYGLIEKGPVIIGTKKLGGLPGGHIILAVGHDGENIICHDPFGDANTFYKNKKGKFVAYGKKMLKESTGCNVTCMYWRQ